MAAPIGIKEAQEHNWVAQVVPTAARARVEIDEFLGDNDMTNLYLLALEAMQKEDPTKSVANGNEDWWTFYSISGIHGSPPEDWDGIPKDLDAVGYCTHGALVFPTWHRVYIAMFEQAMTNKVQDIADQYTSEPERTIYKNAASRFRLPFWDPFLPRNRVNPSPVLNAGIWGVPKILAAKTVYVKRPNSSTLDPISNPLYQFEFPAQDVLREKDREPVDWSRTRLAPQGHEHTIRSPSSNGSTNVNEFNLRIQREGQSTSTKLWKLLSRYNTDNSSRTWEAFSTHWLLDHPSLTPTIDPRTRRPIFRDTSISLESWHDDIHVLVGSGARFEGHMANPTVAGFDPIFWLHHCNIDRLLAIYQALYPDKWVPATELQNDKTPLIPFRKTDDGMWDSNDVRDWKTLGFAVPGSQNLDSEGITKLETFLNEYYSWATEGSFPPPSVAEKWPRDLSHSVALYGDKATPAAKPRVRFDALEKSGLVTRTVTVSTAGQDPKIEVQDQPKQVVVQDAATNNPSLYPPGTIQDGTLPTWNASIRILKFAFEGSFSIHLFIGEIDDDQSSSYMTRTNEVGFSGIFASPPDAPCAGCAAQRESGLIYEDSIPITPSLFAYLCSNDSADGPPVELRTLESFAPEHVVPFLKEHLDWRLVDAASNSIDGEERLTESRLEIAVSVRDFQMPTQGAPMGVYGPAVTYREVTEGRIGGYGHTPAAASSA